MDFLKQADWKSIADYQDRVFVVPINGSGGFIKTGNQKEDFHGIDFYVDQKIHSLTCYKIVYRVMDRNGNLILFTEKEYIEL